MIDERCCGTCRWRRKSKCSMCHGRRVALTDGKNCPLWNSKEELPLTACDVAQCAPSCALGPVQGGKTRKGENWTEHDDGKLVKEMRRLKVTKSGPNQHIPWRARGKGKEVSGE